MGNLLARRERGMETERIHYFSIIVRRSDFCVNKFQLYNLAPTQRFYDVG